MVCKSTKGNPRENSEPSQSHRIRGKVNGLNRTLEFLVKISTGGKKYVSQSKAEYIISVHKETERQYVETKLLGKWSILEQCLREEFAST